MVEIISRKEIVKTRPIRSRGDKGVLGVVVVPQFVGVQMPFANVRRLIALHFANDEALDSLDQHDCVVWRIDARALRLILGAITVSGYLLTFTSCQLALYRISAFSPMKAFPASSSPCR